MAVVAFSGAIPDMKKDKHIAVQLYLISTFIGPNLTGWRWSRSLELWGSALHVNRKTGHFKIANTEANHRLEKISVGNASERYDKSMKCVIRGSGFMVGCEKMNDHTLDLL